MEDDPFGSLIELCQPTSSQEEIFQNCPFARQSEVFPEDDTSSSSEPNETLVEPTGIVMVSLPYSSKDENTALEEDFQTPPEHFQKIDGDKRPTAAVYPHDSQKIDAGGDVETVTVNDCNTDAERTVDLGNDADNLGFSEPQPMPGIDSEYGILGVSRCRGADGVEVSEVFKSELKKLGVLQGELEVPLPKRLRVSEENLCSDTQIIYLVDTDQMMVETDCNENGGTEVIESEVEEVREVFGDCFTENTVIVDTPVKENGEDVRVGKSTVRRKNGEACSAFKNIEELEKFKFVASGGIDRSGKEKRVGGKRELPFSMRAQEKNVGGESVSRVSSAKNQHFKDILDGLKMVAEDVDDGSEDMDFLKTATKRGLTFPRPRWWPLVGFDD